MLALDDVGFGYGDHAVLREITLRVAAGELICIVGANGAGKTTLLRLIAGLLAPTAGRVRCFDLDPATTPRRALARRLSFLPQNYRVAFPFSVEEVVLMGRYAHGARGVLGLETDDDLDAAQRAMERCDVLDLAERPFDTISGGEQRRALLAQSFCQRTELVLLDEPTASLDPAHAIAVFEALATETRDRDATAIAVTHDLNMAARFATRVLVLDEGTVAAFGAPADTLASEATAAAFGVAMHVGALPGGAPFVVPG